MPGRSLSCAGTGSSGRLTRPASMPKVAVGETEQAVMVWKAATGHQWEETLGLSGWESIRPCCPSLLSCSFTVLCRQRIGAAYWDWPMQPRCTPIPRHTICCLLLSVLFSLPRTQLSVVCAPFLSLTTPGSPHGRGPGIGDAKGKTARTERAMDARRLHRDSPSETPSTPLSMSRDALSLLAQTHLSCVTQIAKRTAGRG
jgi:hypothetical protein